MKQKLLKPAQDSKMTAKTNNESIKITHCDKDNIEHNPDTQEHRHQNNKKPC
jgi:hypothetical protein